MPFSQIGNNESVPDRAAKFYIDQLLLPVGAHSFSIKTNGQNESDSLTDGRPYTFLKRERAQNMTIEFIVPIRNIGSHLMEAEEPVKTYTDYFWTKQSGREPVVLTIVYADGSTFNHKVMIDNWNYTQDATYGSDWKFTLEVTEYIPIANQQLGENDVLVPQGNRDSSRVMS